MDRVPQVVIDISDVEIVDSFIGRMFASVASLSKVLDAETVVVGIRPAVAIRLVELGLSLRGVRTGSGCRAHGAPGACRRTRATRTPTFRQCVRGSRTRP